MDVSVILQFHDEGWLAHPTLRALHRVVRHAEERGKAVEVVATLDRTHDDNLRRIVRAWSERFSAFHVHEVSLGDPALSRNYAVSQARGRYIATHDGDNLYGRSWLARAHDHVQGRGLCVAHPLLIWIFQGRHTFWAQGPIEDLSDFLRLNPWDTVCLAPREVFERVPYRAATHALAYEDWAWNCDTIAAGFEHVFVPETLIAKREKPAHLSNEGAWIASGKTVHPNPLFETILRTLPPPGPPDPPGPAVQPPSPPSPGSVRYLRAKEAFKRRHPVAFRRLLRVKQRLTGTLPPEPAAPAPASTPPTPAWALRELDELKQLEPALGDYSRLSLWPLWRTGLSRFITPEMGALLDAERPVVMLLPWLERGGADLEALHYLHAVEGPTFAVLTAHGENRWKDRVPPGCTVVDLSHMDIARELKLALLHRLLLQCRPRLIHNLNSKEAYDLFLAHPASFDGMRKCATFFCADQTESGAVTGYIVEYLPRLLGFFDRISTDSDSFRRYLIELLGLPQERVEWHRMPFSPPHFPMQREPASPRRVQPSAQRPLRLLFAGRFDRQKRPDLAFEIVRGLIAEGLPVQLDLWGAAHLDPHYFPVPDPLPAGIRYRGAFDGLAGLPLEEYDLLLMPSKWEGLPNTLLEAMGNGLPVMAAAVGGVPELVDERTGWRIDAIDDVEAYRSALRSILADPGQVESRSRAGMQVAGEQRSWRDFVDQARRFYGMEG